MIDTHCHLADSTFSADLPEVLKRASEAGVGTILSIADSIEEAEKCVQLAEKHENIFCTIGIHPHNAKTWDADCESRLRSLLARSDKVRAIGEIGLDYHYDHSPRETQREAFRKQLRLAKDVRLPAVVHNRKSIADLRAIIEEADPDKLVLHCCTERFEDVRFLLDRGYFLSFTGIATYPYAEEIRETIRRCPLGQMMVETDAPYLAPVPYRGKRNEPAYVMEVLKLIAQIKGLALEDVDEATTENAVRFFGLPTR